MLHVLPIINNRAMVFRRQLNSLERAFHGHQIAFLHTRTILTHPYWGYGRIISYFLYLPSCHWLILWKSYHSTFAPHTVCLPSEMFQAGMPHQEESRPKSLKALCSSIASYNNHLLAIPGECNFSGIKCNFDFVKREIHEACLSSSSKWHWLLDASKLASSSGINLSVLQPSFCVIRC